MKLRIGIAPCMIHAPPGRDVRGASTLYAEESTVDWVRTGAVPLILPRPGDGITADDIVAGLDGLVLHGGVDVAPGAYGAVPIKDDWAGDAVRDGYELALARAALDAGLPVFGICRGMQLINVALGGSLLQDIAYCRPASQAHVAFIDGTEDLDLAHEIVIAPGSWLGGWYGVERGRVNSIHHQALDRLGRGVVVEALADDGIVEAVRVDGAWAYAVQWHPEYMHGTRHGGLEPTVLLDAFLGRAAERKTCRS